MDRLDDMGIHGEALNFDSAHLCSARNLCSVSFLFHTEKESNAPPPPSDNNFYSITENEVQKPFNAKMCQTKHWKIRSHGKSDQLSTIEEPSCYTNLPLRSISLSRSCGCPTWVIFLMQPMFP